MKKKGLLLLFIFTAAMIFTGISSFASPLSPAFSVLSHKLSANICGLAGNTVHFSESFLKEALNSPLIGKVTVTSLPSKEKGALFIEGRPLLEGDNISNAALGKLTFVPKDSEAISADFSLSVVSCGTTYDLACTVHMLENLNFAPKVSSDKAVLSAFSGVSAYGLLEGHDPDGDEIVFEITKFPKKGSLILTDAQKGRYVYTPNKGAQGEDEFEYVIYDVYGNISVPSSVIISLTQIPEENVYSDMHLDPAATAATCLSELGIFRGERIGGQLYFNPQKAVCAEEFLMMALPYAGITPSSNDSSYPYTETALSLGILSGDDAGKDKMLTLSEGAAIIQRLNSWSKTPDEYVFSPIIPTDDCLDQLVFQNASLFFLETEDDTALTRKNAVSLVVNCISKQE